jgi:hypothetical protein
MLNSYKWNDNIRSYIKHIINEMIISEVILNTCSIVINEMIISEVILNTL